MPLTFDGTSPVMQSFSDWSINAVTGAFSVAPGNNYALNPSFEADRVSTTAPAGWSTTNGSNVSGGHSGKWSWQLSGASNLEQKLSGIPNGTYTLAVWVRGGAGTLSAKGFGGADKSAPIAAATAFTKVTLSGVAVSNGSCLIGVSTSSGTLSVDDFSLVAN